MAFRCLSLLVALVVALAGVQSAVAQCPGPNCLYDESRQIGAEASDWDGFGLMQDGQSNSDELRPGAFWEVYIDDLTYSVQGGTESQSFDTNAAATTAGWVGRDNGPGKVTTTEDPPGNLLVDPTDYGYRNSSHTPGSPGEAGGIIARGSSPTGYYADTTIGTVDMTTDDFHASGRLFLDGTVADNAMFLGWIEAAVAPDEQREEFMGFFIFEGTDPVTDNRSARVRIGIEGDNGQNIGNEQRLSEVITKNPHAQFTLDYSATTGVLRGTIFVPEPSSVLLGVMALLGCLAVRRRHVH